jgi:mannose-6-phosphate isomerase-like protein (cupin superfamily)
MEKLETILKRFEAPDEVRVFEKGKFELIRLGGMTIGRATYQPGWKWSADVGPGVVATRCNVEHVGMVLSGCATAAMDDGTIHEVRAGTVFYIPPGPPGHDSWSWAMSLMFRCIFSGANITQRSNVSFGAAGP